MKRRLIITATLLLLVAACGDDAGGATTVADTATAGTTAAPPTTVVPPATDAPPTTVAPSTAAPTTTIPPTTTTAPGTVIEVEVVGGESSGDDRYEVKLGDPVTVVVTADAADEVHVHGYDLVADLVPGEPSTIEFVADIPGIFEVELEVAHTLLFEIVVS